MPTYAQSSLLKALGKGQQKAAAVKPSSKTTMTGDAAKSPPRGNTRYNTRAAEAREGDEGNGKDTNPNKDDAMEVEIIASPDRESVHSDKTKPPRTPKSDNRPKKLARKTDKDKDESAGTLVTPPQLQKKTQAAAGGKKVVEKKKSKKQIMAEANADLYFYKYAVDGKLPRPSKAKVENRYQHLKPFEMWLSEEKGDDSMHDALQKTMILCHFIQSTTAMGHKYCRKYGEHVYDAHSFNQPLSWNTSNVINMKGVFHGAHSFNQLLPWNTSNITNMGSMFYQARSFNQHLCWDTSHVTNMEGMFCRAYAFNQPLPWDTSNVTNVESMFSYAHAFNQPLAWNTINVTTMYAMFTCAYAFNQSLEAWDISHVTNIKSMFQNASSYNQPMKTWDTRKIFDMNGTFANACSFNQSLKSWSFHKYANTVGMLHHATSYKQELPEALNPSDVGY